MLRSYTMRCNLRTHPELCDWNCYIMHALLERYKCFNNVTIRKHIVNNLFPPENLCWEVTW